MDNDKVYIRQLALDFALKLGITSAEDLVARARKIEEFLCERRVDAKAQ